MKGAQTNGRKTVDSGQDEKELALQEILKELKKINSQVDEIERIANTRNAKQSKRSKPSSSDIEAVVDFP